MNGHREAGDLAQVNEILESILSNMGDAVIVAGRDGKFLVANPAAQRMFGESATDITVADWPRRQGLYLPDKVTLFPSDQTPLARAIRGEETNRVEMFVRHAQVPGGLWTRINGRPLRATNGEVIGGVIVCRDITEAKEEEFFRAGQSRVLELIAADAALSEILTNLVLLMEGQAEGLRCSVLLLSRDGLHVQHGAAPNLPADKLKSRSLFLVAREDSNGAGLRLPGIRAQYEKAPEPKELIVLDGSAHAQFLFQTEHRERVMREILRFLSAP